MVIWSHKALFERAGLQHGIGAICCGCQDCYCVNPYLQKYKNLQKNKKKV